MNNIAFTEFLSIVTGGSILAINAGYINVVTLTGTLGLTVSHATGNTSKLAIAIYQGDSYMVMEISSVLFCFVLGSFVSGYVVGDSKFRLGRSYGWALLIEAVTLFIAFMLIALYGNPAGAWFAAFSCGLQNALTTTYSGAVIRTTHVTGTLTDIGNILGQACRHDAEPELWRLKVHIPLVVSFATGGILGKIVYSYWGNHALVFPSLIVGCVAAVYLILPVMRDARKTFLEGLLLTKGQRPEMEIRVIGDPTRRRTAADVYAELVSQSALDLHRPRASITGSKLDLSTVMQPGGSIPMDRLTLKSSVLGEKESDYDEADDEPVGETSTLQGTPRVAQGGSVVPDDRRRASGTGVRHSLQHHIHLRGNVEPDLEDAPVTPFISHAGGTVDVIYASPTVGERP